MTAGPSTPAGCSDQTALGHVLVCLPGGGSVQLRPLRPRETGPLLTVFDGLSGASRAGRYLTGMPRLPAPLRDALLAVDGRHHVAWLAVAAGRPVGIGRYVEVAPGTAEIAFEVVDDAQGRGIGTGLLDTITTVAAARGIRRVRATVLPGNAASLRLLARLGIPLTLCDGVLEGEGALTVLTPARVDRSRVVTVACRRTGGAPDAA